MYTTTTHVSAARSVRRISKKISINKKINIHNNILNVYLRSGRPVVVGRGCPLKTKQNLTFDNYIYAADTQHPRPHTKVVGRTPFSLLART